MYEKYDHHGTEVVVRSDLKGQHRDHCLCYACDKFHPEDREKNCHIANALYALDVEHSVVTPVWECPIFIEKENKT